ncbi:MAG: hypothetical protein MRZ79_05985 [Bacteroidia bacterium]|nr:hypothetical protein [Bacteroidia bacterium]
MKKCTAFILGFLAILIPKTSTYAQPTYQYSINLKDHKTHKVEVILDIPESFRPKEGTTFQLPKTVPGTYAEYDYGRFVTKFKAFDESGAHLKVKRKKKNSFIIQEGGLSKISYTFKSTWKGFYLPFIFPPAGCAFIPDEYAVINGGMFGYVSEGIEKPYQISLLLPGGMNAFASAPKTQHDQGTHFHLENYHEVIDHPILVTPQQSALVNVANTEVSVAAHTPFDSSSYRMAIVLEEVMEAIEKFVGETPVDNYSYLIFYTDKTKLQKVMNKIIEDGKNGPFRTFRLISGLGLKSMLGSGALEHGTSSMYYLPGIYDKGHEKELPDIAIHEFMHIYAPLSVHSEYIGNFDYASPKMSKHLWLYEGVTEYFAELIQLQGGLVPLHISLNSNFKNKISDGLDWPEGMSFTAMSENVFDKPYKKQYGKVYTRGAVLAMLLDFEIMDLTDGKKTLKDVVFNLSKTYGSDKSIPEDELINIFVNEVHPDLIHFFNDYIMGSKELDIKAGFEKVGISYTDSISQVFPGLPWGRRKDVRIISDSRDGNTKVLKIKEGANTPFKQGDIIKEPNMLRYYDFDPETARLRDNDSEFTIDIIRDGKPQQVSIQLKSKKRKIWRLSFPMNQADMSEKQKMLFELWTKGRP